MISELFHFNKFSMYQAPTGQRISTDSVVFGHIAACHSHPKMVLDIGAGTGVLSFMLASAHARSNVTAIEPDASVFLTLRQNANQTLWENRVIAFKKKLQDFTSSTSYDVIICNPPFFETGPTSSAKSRAHARHQSLLKISELANHGRKFLASDGKFFLLAPSFSVQRWLTTFEQSGLYCNRIITLTDKPGKPSHASIVVLTGDKPDYPGQEAIQYRLPCGTTSPALAQVQEIWLRHHQK